MFSKDYLILIQYYKKNYDLYWQVDVGGGKYVHLRVYQPLPHTGLPPELSGIQLNKTADDEITYF